MLETKENITRFIAEGKVDKAIIILIEHLESNSNKELFQEALHISSQYVELNKQIRRGLLSPEFASSQQSRIIYSLLQIVDNAYVNEPIPKEKWCKLLLNWIVKLINRIKKLFNLG